MKIRPHTITGFDEPSDSSVNEIAVVQIDIDEHQKSRTFFYIAFKLAFYNLILDLLWMKQNKIILNADRVSLTIEFTKTIIWNRKASAENEFNHVMMSATFFTNLVWKKRETKEDWGVLSQHDWYWKSLNLTKEDWLKNYTLWSLSWVFKCVWLYDDWEVAFLKRKRHRSSDWTKKDEWKRVKSTLRSFIQHGEKEATSVAQNINRTFE